MTAPALLDSGDGIVILGKSEVSKLVDRPYFKVRLPGGEDSRFGQRQVNLV
jgi:hypothetical protein